MAGTSLRNFFDAFLAAASLEICSDVVVGAMSQYLPKILCSLLPSAVVILIGDYGNGCRRFPVAVFIGRTAPIS